MAKTAKPSRILQHPRCASTFALLLAVVPACSGPRPVLYPNSHLEAVGAEAAKGDVAECIEKAKSYGLDPYLSSGASKATRKATQQGATGAATEAVSGGDPTGVAVEHATRAGIGGLMDALFGEKKLDPDFQRYVEDCLMQKGYQLGAWK